MKREAVDGQLARFRALLGREPTHLHSHQHVHLREPARSALIDAGSNLRVPVRHFDAGVRYCGDFHGQVQTGEPLPEAVTADALIEVVRALGEAVTELACHPGLPGVGGTSYATERGHKLEALCDPCVHAAVERAGETLRSFAAVRAAPI